MELCWTLVLAREMSSKTMGERGLELLNCAEVFSETTAIRLRPARLHHPVCSRQSFRHPAASRASCLRLLPPADNAGAAMLVNPNHSLTFSLNGVKRQRVPDSCGKFRLLSNSSCRLGVRPINIVSRPVRFSQWPTLG
jgi:hypothetical protein